MAEQLEADAYATSCNQTYAQNTDIEWKERLKVV